MTMFRVWSDEQDLETDAVEVEAFSDGDAAREWAERLDGRDTPTTVPTVDGGAVKVHVMDLANWPFRAPKITTWRVTAHAETVHVAERAEVLCELVPR